MFEQPDLNRKAFRPPEEQKISDEVDALRIFVCALAAEVTRQHKRVKERIKERLHHSETELRRDGRGAVAERVTALAESLSWNEPK